MSHPLQLLLLLALIIASAKLAGALASRIGQPAVFGEILIGLLLGPTLLDILNWRIFAMPSSETWHAQIPLMGIVGDLAAVGVILLMFIAGLETDLNEMRRVGAAAFWSAVGGVVLPFVGGAATASAFGFPLRWEGVFIGTILTATSVSISAQTLLELGALKSREGSTILGAAVIDDVMGIIVLSVVVALARSSTAGGAGGIAIVVLRMAGYFVVAWMLGRYFNRIAAWANRLGVSQGLLGVTLIIMFVYAWAAEYLGRVAAITGSYLAGVLFTRTSFKKNIDVGIHPLTYSMFVPMFFVSIGLSANARDLGARAAFAGILVLVAIVTKALGCALGARLAGLTTIQATRVGAGMISRGEVGLIVAGYGLAAGLIGQDVFSASVIMVLVTTMVTPPLVRLTFPRQRSSLVVLEETIASEPQEGKTIR